MGQRGASAPARAAWAPGNTAKYLTPGVAPPLLTNPGMKTRECMSRNVTTIEASASCREAVALMYREKIRHLPVVNAAGQVVGIVTDRDLRHRLFEPSVFRAVGTRPVDALLEATPVSTVMSTPAVTAGPEDDLGGAAQQMVEHKVGSLPVVEGGRVLGIITETDLLRRIVQADGCGEDVATIVVSYP